MSNHLVAAAVVAAATAVTLNLSVAAVAGEARNTDSVTACSTYGRHGCVTAPIRRGRFGLELRSRGGVWIDCEGDCRDTLRRRTVDFWDEQLKNSDSD